MINLIHAELYKLRKSKALKICFLIVAVCAIALAVISNGIANGTIEMSEQTASGLSDIFIISVLGPLMAGIIICSDFESKDIHDEISCGRWAIVVSKSVVFLIMILILVLPYALTAFIGYVGDFEFSVPFSYSTYTLLLKDKSIHPADAARTGKAVIVLFVSLLTYAARLSYCIPVAMKGKKTFIVIAISVIFGYVNDLFLAALGKIEIIDKILELTPFHYPCIDMGMTYGELAKIVCCDLVFFLLMMLLTYRLFKKTEIK